MLNLIPWKRNLPRAERPQFPLPDFRQEMHRLFDRFLSEPWGGPSGFSGVADPVRMEVSETDDEICVRAEVPGIDPEDLDIQLVDKVLVLSGEKKEPDGEQHGGRTYSERSYGWFRRTLELSAPVDPEAVKAEHRHGVVTIVLTKSWSARPRRIQVRSE
jgi:HSP20 family protein